jgi:pimeloyl-ACP methyl ester carboxylesterase
MQLNPIHLCWLAAWAFTACSPTDQAPRAPLPSTAIAQLKAAQKATRSDEERLVLYLNSARLASANLSSSESARQVYNSAAADLTVLLRTAQNGALWNQKLTLKAGPSSYQLRFAKGTRNGIWNPAYFTSLTHADRVRLKTIKRSQRQIGSGGALVGIRKNKPFESFSPWVGVTAPVTAVLDFHGADATLSLLDPTQQSSTLIAGKPQNLEANFSAPLAYYPQKPELLEGILGALRVAQHMESTGLYMLQPYDPERTPVIFVHGLISTPRMWRNVINELESDPIIRRRYQFGVFSYPTGNPPLYSALRLRDDLAKFYQQHPKAADCVLVGHSMGGILSRAQVTTLRRSDWNEIGAENAQRLFAKVKSNDLIHRATLFTANPKVARTVFICTPHRGSEMAIGSLGQLAVRLIALPSDLASTLTSTLGESLAIVTGDPNRLPNSIAGLSPKNPTFKVLENRPIETPHHSIIGDRGKGDTPNSTDGVVGYWSSHLKSAQSESIVPGPHGACELPETIEEIKRLLRLHLNSARPPTP